MISWKYQKAIDIFLSSKPKKSSSPLADDVVKKIVRLPHSKRVPGSVPGSVSFWGEFDSIHPWMDGHLSQVAELVSVVDHILNKKTSCWCRFYISWRELCLGVFSVHYADTQGINMLCQMYQDPESVWQSCCWRLPWRSPMRRSRRDEAGPPACGPFDSSAAPLKSWPAQALAGQLGSD